MSRAVTVKEAAGLLLAADDILILFHQYPDGDAIGSSYALAYALRSLGKRVRPLCCDPIPKKYAYITKDADFPDFPARFICTVDVADPKLLGALADQGGHPDLCIDHHGTNIDYAENLLLDADCGAAAMVMRRVIDALGVTLTPLLANCLYTGVATDTGCFKYANTDPAAHRLAAELMECGADYAAINEAMFDCKSRERMTLECLAISQMQYFFGGRCAVMILTNQMIADTGVQETDIEGLSSIPRRIEGVQIGVTLRQKADGNFKVSLRTDSKTDAAAIAAVLGGGGHRGAAGCTVTGTAEEAVALLLDTIRASIPQIEE